MDVFSKVAKYKITQHNSGTSIYVNNNMMRKKSGKQFPSQNIQKHLGVNQTKEVKYFYNENLKNKERTRKKGLALLQ